MHPTAELNAAVPETERHSEAEPSVQTPSAFAKPGQRIWQTAFPLVLVLALGLWVRLHSLAAKSLWLDEGVSAMITRLSRGNFWALILLREGNMMPYYLTLRVWAKFGFSEFHLRLLSVIAGVLALAGIYLLGKELYGRGTGLLAALLLALHSFHVHYSQEARSYALLNLTLIVAAYFLVRASRSSSTTLWIPGVFFSALSVYLHFLSGFVVLALFCSVSWRAVRAIGARGYARVLVLLGILLVPAAHYVLQHRDLSMNWIRPPSWLLLAHCGGALLGAGGILGLLYLIVWLLPMALRRMQSAQSEIQEVPASAIVPAMWAFLPGVLLLAISFFRPILSERYLVISVPGLVLLVSCTVMRLQKHWRLPVAAALVVISAVSLSGSYQDGPTEDWRGAVEYAVRHSKPGDVVVMADGIARPVFEYYRTRTGAFQLRAYSFFPRSDEPIFSDFFDAPDPADLDRIFQLHPRVWTFQWQGKRELDVEIDKHFRKLDEQQFTNVGVRLYTRNSD
jgi:hypothetical protein